MTGCALADSECHGRLEWDHVVKQQRIKREYKHGAVWSQVVAALAAGPPGPRGTSSPVHENDVLDGGEGEG